MRQSLRLACVSGALAAGLVIACVGDDPAVNTTSSTEAGAADSSAVPDSPSGLDGSTGADAADAAAAIPCGPERTFKTSQHLTDLDIDAGANPIQWVSLLPDEKTIYVVRASNEAFYAQRTGLGQPFGSSTLLASKVSEVSVTVDFLAERLFETPTTYNVNIFARDAVTFWNAGTGFTGTVTDHIQGSLSADSLQMVALNTSPLVGDDKLKRLARGSLATDFTSIGDALDNNVAGSDSSPVLSADALTLVFARNGSYFFATRTSKNAIFTVQGPLLLGSGLVPVGAFYPPRWISPDFCRLYVTTPNQGVFVLTQ
jgi:hypothetical protein